MSRGEVSDKAAVKYLASLSAFCGGFSLLVLSLTLTLDPYGVSPLGLDIPSFNEDRYMRHQVDRLVKPLDVLAQRPRTILIGTSRVNQGFEPEDFEGTELAPVYNLGVDFANPTDTIALLETLLPLVSSIEVAVIEVHFHHFFNLRTNVLVPKNTGELVTSALKAQFSWSALKATLVSILKNRSYPESAYWLKPDGRMLLPERKAFMTDVENYLTRRLGPSYAGGFLRDLSEQNVLFDRIQGVCDANDVRCMFVVLPYQPVDLTQHIVTDRWPDLERAKRFFLGRGGVYDFSRYNRFTNEPRSNEMLYWQDINHFTPTVGRYIGHVLGGEPLPDTPENFGVLLDENNFDAEMAAWARERDEWLGDNLDFREQVRAAIFGEQKAADK